MVTKFRNILFVKPLKTTAHGFSHFSLDLIFFYAIVLLFFLFFCAVEKFLCSCFINAFRFQKTLHVKLPVPAFQKKKKRIITSVSRSVKTWVSLKWAFCLLKLFVCVFFFFSFCFWILFLLRNYTFQTLMHNQCIKERKCRTVLLEYIRKTIETMRNGY